MISEATDAVSEWEDLIDGLVSIHADRIAVVDWEEIANSREPVQPSVANYRELHARTAITEFKPRLFDFLTGGSTKRKDQLEDALEVAIAEDREEAQAVERGYQAAVSEWKADIALARRLLAGEPEAIRDVISEMQSLSTVDLIGTEIRFRISGSTVHAISHIHGDEIVPRVRRKQLTSGRLSESRMPTGEFNELYQDYVCSAALRVGGDLLSLLPIPEVYVTCAPLILDTSSGHQRHTPILSIQIVRETLDQLRLSAIDPSDSLMRFNHVMNFKRAKGFTEIKPLRPLTDG